MVSDLIDRCIDVLEQLVVDQSVRRDPFQIVDPASRPSSVETRPPPALISCIPAACDTTSALIDTNPSMRPAATCDISNAPDTTMRTPRATLASRSTIADVRRTSAGEKCDVRHTEITASASRSRLLDPRRLAVDRRELAADVAALQARLRRVDQPELYFAVRLVGNRHREPRQSRREIHGPVERIDDPPVAGVADRAALLGEDRRSGRQAEQPVDDDFFRGKVGFGDDVEQVLPFGAQRRGLHADELRCGIGYDAVRAAHQFEQIGDGWFVHSCNPATSREKMAVKKSRGADD
jgi:hypothetical protein